MRNIIIAFIILSSLPAYAQQSISLMEAQKVALETNVQILNSKLETKAAFETKAHAETNYYPTVGLDMIAMHAINPLLEINSPGGDLPVYDGNPENLGTASQFAYIPPSTTGLLQKMGAASLSVTQPIYIGGKIKMGNQMAQIGIDIRKEQEQLSTKEVILATAQQYWQIVSLQEKQKTIEKYEELLNRLSIQVNDAYKAGLIIRNDVYKLELEQNELALNKSKLENGKQLALLQFCNTTGIPFDSTLYLEDNIDQYGTPLQYESSGNDYVNDLTEVHLLEKSIQIQELQTKMKEADSKPSVALGLNAFYLSQFEEKTSGLNAFGFVSVSVPISDHWSGKHDVNELLIKEEIAHNTLNNTKSLLELRASNSWTDLKNTHYQIGIIEERILAAEENLKVNQASYDSGIITLSDVLEAKAMQAQAKDDLIEAKTKYQVAIASYLQNTGK